MKQDDDSDEFNEQDNDDQNQNMISADDSNF